jgi:hypothetical protein
MTSTMITITTTVPMPMYTGFLSLWRLPVRRSRPGYPPRRGLTAWVMLLNFARLARLCLSHTGWSRDLTGSAPTPTAACLSAPFSRWGRH